MDKNDIVVTFRITSTISKFLDKLKIEQGITLRTLLRIIVTEWCLQHGMKYEE